MVRIKTFAAAYTLVTCVLQLVSFADDSRDRRQFIKALALIKEADTRARVESIVGKPDDTRPTRVGAGPTVTGNDVWCYGTDGHLSFPTLGRVTFRRDRVNVVIGAQGAPPNESLITENDLRILLRAVSHLPARTGDEYSARDMIIVVNALQPLGKQRALAVLREYLRLCTVGAKREYQGIELLLRVLFEPPKDKGHFPALPWGPTRAMPDDPLEIPGFPILVEGDIPFSLHFGSIGGGAFDPPGKNPAEMFEPSMAYCESQCALRSKPLTPCNDPLAVPDRILKDHGFGGDSTVVVLLNNQVAGLLQSERTRTDRELRLRFQDPGQTWWYTLQKRLERSRLQWDPVLYEYRIGTSDSGRKN
jgi:hypothetical protein